MTGFEPGTSGFGSNCSTNWADPPLLESDFPNVSSREMGRGKRMWGRGNAAKKLTHFWTRERERHSRCTSECVILSSWSSLDKEESMACQLTSPFNKKIGCFLKGHLLYFVLKTTQPIVKLWSYLTSQWLREWERESVCTENGIRRERERARGANHFERALFTPSFCFLFFFTTSLLP